MGLSLSHMHTEWEDFTKFRVFNLKLNHIFPSGEAHKGVISSTGADMDDVDNIGVVTCGCEKTVNSERKNSLKNMNPVKVALQTTVSFKHLLLNHEITTCYFTPKGGSDNNNNNNYYIPSLSPPDILIPQTPVFFSPKPVSELNAAAVKLQKVYKSYRTRRNLADCAVVVEELWWKALDFAALKRSSVSFFSDEKPETAISRWVRAKTRVAKVGKGLSKDDKARKLALQHWLEAIDPRHRYGHNLHLYYDLWFESESSQPFFYWLDVGAGREVNLASCTRPVLQRQCIKYLGPKEREAYEVVVEGGRLVYKGNGAAVETEEGSKWIFVLSTVRKLYVGKKMKGLFQHSSFLSGGATTAAGRMVVHCGVLEAVWPYSGHYHPTEENFHDFILFLQDHNVDLTTVKRCAVDEDGLSSETGGGWKKDVEIKESQKWCEEDKGGKPLVCKWSTGAGPRISCVRDYPSVLQVKALEQVKLSPRNPPFPPRNYGPIPSPRPSPKHRLSPRFDYMGLPSPRMGGCLA